ncbi:MAG: PAS domain S-box protein [Terriglobales bacterium]
MNTPTKILAIGEAGPDPRFRQVFEAAPIGMGICNFDGRILEANSALGSLLGYDRNELAGINLWNSPAAESHDAPTDADAIDSDPTNVVSIDGRPFVSELMLGERDSFAIEKRYRRTDASEFWGRLTVSLARDSHGNPAFLVALLEDATGPRRAQENLRQAEKMEVIGRLTGGIAHDFNNLLTGILLYADLMLAQLEPQHQIRCYVEEVRLASEHGADLTHKLLALVREQALEPRPLPINEIVSSTENLLRRLIGQQIELVTLLDPLAGLVFFDPGQLRQILLNLVLNARDAIRQYGTIRLSTRLTEFPGPGNGKPQPAVSLIVEDNGCGMSAETRARLFEPFFSTKESG